MPAPATETEQRNQLRQQIGQHIYSTVEKAPMSFVADGGHTALMLAELALKLAEEAGWQAPTGHPGPLVDAAEELERLWEIGQTPHNQLNTQQRADYNAYKQADSTAAWLRARATL